MKYWWALSLGAIQGISEFLPISSSSHLLLLRKILHIENIPPIFDICLHCATLITVCIVFKKVIIDMLLILSKKYIKKSTLNINEDLLHQHFLMMIIASGTTAITSLLIIPLTSLTELHPKKLAIGFLYTATMLFVARFTVTKSNQASKNWIKNGLIIGLFQSFAILPGVSRSGSTIFSLLLCGYKVREAITLAFLLSIPIVKLSLLYSLRNFDTNYLKENFNLILLAGSTALLLGIPTLKIFLKYINSRKKLIIFSCYLMPLAAILLFS